MLKRCLCQPQGIDQASRGKTYKHVGQVRFASEPRQGSQALFSLTFCGGEGGIRTHVPVYTDHLISSQRRYDRFGTSPERMSVYTTREPRLEQRVHRLAANQSVGFDPPCMKPETNGTNSLM